MNNPVQVIQAMKSFVGVQDLEDDAPVIILLPGLTGGSHDTYVRCAQEPAGLHPVRQPDSTGREEPKRVGRSGRAAAPAGHCICRMASNPDRGALGSTTC